MSRVCHVVGNALCDLCKHALDVQLVLLHVQLTLRARSSCILRRAVRIPRDPTAVTLSGCDDRWTRVELDPTPADTLFLVSDNSDGKS